MNNRLTLRAPLIPEPRDELTEAFENYKALKIEHARVVQENIDLRVENGALAGEVAMLREQVGQSDTDRIRLQAVASSMAGGLRAINAVIADQLRTALKNGLDAVQKADAQDLDPAGAEASEILERVEPVEHTEPVETHTADTLPKAEI